jgi:hypothetical protein
MRNKKRKAMTRARQCGACMIVSMWTDAEWAAHLKSGKHKRNLKKVAS